MKGKYKKGKYKEKTKGSFVPKILSVNAVRKYCRGFDGGIAGANEMNGNE